jgi:RHS repeat-associated protein
VPTYSYNSSNELTSNSTGSYTYDANGNTLSDAQGRSFTWDFENRLTQAVVPGTGTTTFRYDPFGRRIYKQSPSFAGTFVYDGYNLLETLNSSGTEISNYAQTQNIDEALGELRGSTNAYYEADGLGSITSLSTSAGAVANTYTYYSFGNLTNCTLRNPFQYTGREFDQETNLYFYRARYYDPTIGRFLSEDPLRFKAGANLLEDPFHYKPGTDFYNYAFNSPLQWRDPDGKKVDWGTLGNIVSWLKCIIYGAVAGPTIQPTSQSIGDMSTDAILNTAIARQNAGQNASTLSNQNVQQGCSANRNIIAVAQNCGQSSVLGVSAVSPPIP